MNMPQPVAASIRTATTTMSTPILVVPSPLYRISDGHAASVSRVEVTSAVGQLRCTATVNAATNGRPRLVSLRLVTSEWSQHTALTTFTLVPRRSRIIAAKVAAGVLLAAAATVMCVAVTAVVLLAADHGQAGLWQDAGRAIGYAFVFQILNLLLGVGFGLLFHSTPVAIVVYFAAPTAWSILTGTVSALAGTGRWLDPSTAWNHLAGGTMTATTWAQVGTAAAAWIALPALAGGWRVLHRPVDV
jgi:hypothetical protein